MNCCGVIPCGPRVPAEYQSGRDCNPTDSQLPRPAKRQQNSGHCDLPAVLQSRAETDLTRHPGDGPEPSAQDESPAGSFVFSPCIWNSTSDNTDLHGGRSMRGTVTEINQVRGMAAVDTVEDGFTIIELPGEGIEVGDDLSWSDNHPEGSRTIMNVSKGRTMSVMFQSHGVHKSQLRQQLLY
jgi:hypothetical protein